MKNLARASIIVVTAFFLVSVASDASFGQCFLNCPAGDGGVVGPGAGNKSPDLDGSAAVNLVDLALFAAAWPPNPYDFCADYNCDGLINLPDLSLFAIHWTHVGNVPGFCQPGVDHYKPYEVLGPSINGPITLEDQFGTVTITSLVLTKFATPVSKNLEPILDPVAHQTWWEFLFDEPTRIVVARDQFGEHEWVLGNSRFLLNPALKFPQDGDELPKLNHYKCYEAQGPTQGITVRLRDQFGEETVFVAFGKYFCNPVRKTTPDGTISDIIDPLAHLTCYFLDNPEEHQITVTFRDQFMEEAVVLQDNLCLCLPALKRKVIGEGTSQWDRIKALYE